MDADRALAVRAVAAHLARGVSDVRQTPVAVIPTKRNADVNQEGNKSVTTQQRERATLQQQPRTTKPLSGLIVWRRFYQQVLKNVLPSFNRMSALEEY